MEDRGLRGLVRGKVEITPTPKHSFIELVFFKERSRGRRKHLRMLKYSSMMTNKNDKNALKAF
jgi:hypothetical protein